VHTSVEQHKSAGGKEGRDRAASPPRANRKATTLAPGTEGDERKAKAFESKMPGIKRTNQLKGMLLATQFYSERKEKKGNLSREIRRGK